MSGLLGFAVGPCICCGRFFTFHPHKVPSTTALTGEREPICRRCIDKINAERIAQGLEPFAIKDGAYDPGEI
jgi:hypothetical protein